MCPDSSRGLAIVPLCLSLSRPVGLTWSDTLDLGFEACNLGSKVAGLRTLELGSIEGGALAWRRPQPKEEVATTSPHSSKLESLANAWRSPEAGPRPCISHVSRSVASTMFAILRKAGKRCSG
ncbi:hypothetical protein NL676_010442 [Syzygium grande]|nr:hypothetical protein NL676_010442 [Syzygium grande]